MSLIIDDSVDAFCEGRRFHRSNMAVKLCGPHVHMYQHGNLIAQRDLDKGLYDTRMSCAGWWTVTTKLRLTELLQRVTMGAWCLFSNRGEWELHSRTHGESLTFKGSVYVSDLVDLDETIIKERLAREEGARLARVSELAA